MKFRDEGLPSMLKKMPAGPKRPMRLVRGSSGKT